MYLAVKKAPVGNSEKLPEGYPWKCMEMQDDVTCPEGHTKMTVDELKSAKDNMKVEYDKWKKDIYKPYVLKTKRQQMVMDKLREKLNEFDRIGPDEELTNEELNDKNIIKASMEKEEIILEKIVL